MISTRKTSLMKSLASYTSGRILHQSIVHISSSTSILPRWQQDWMIIRMDWTTIVALYLISSATSMHIFFLLIPRQDYNRSLMRYPSWGFFARSARRWERRFISSSMSTTTSPTWFSPMRSISWGIATRPTERDTCASSSTPSRVRLAIAWAECSSRE